MTDYVIYAGFQESTARQILQYVNDKYPTLQAHIRLVNDEPFTYDCYGVVTDDYGEVDPKALHDELQPIMTELNRQREEKINELKKSPIWALVQKAIPGLITYDLCGIQPELGKTYETKTDQTS
jgi:hypothetical protein